jgi:UDP-N-acetyl-D-galactosamine dehydrogenase
MRLMTQKRIHIVDSQILVLGLAFKENCPDLRNTRVVDIVRDLQNSNAVVDVYDPWVDAEECQSHYGIDLVQKLEAGKYDAIIMAVAHDQFRNMDIADIQGLGKANCVIYDIKYLLPKETIDGRL